MKKLNEQELVIEESTTVKAVASKTLEEVDLFLQEGETIYILENNLQNLVIEFMFKNVNYFTLNYSIG